MKTYSAIVASLLLAAGSATVYAGDTNFADADQNGDGSLDRQEAAIAGVSNNDFQDLDRNGDGVLSQSEYSQHSKDKDEDKTGGDRWGTDSQDDSNNDRN